MIKITLVRNGKMKEYEFPNEEKPQADRLWENAFRDLSCTSGERVQRDGKNVKRRTFR